ncbi:hypothetical protein JIQ42_04357 [Leishmania sp. Namibia]|uniref:hypothetical protein n=1 Tax=Leishmania sp. Namibia TaxID=2802991 RepID=UPI001B4470DA|nr:hypothetical protein JIQ42_04357 [Leishmania sp. Namibia]
MQRLGGGVLFACCGTRREELRCHGSICTRRAIVGTAAMSTPASSDTGSNPASAARLARAAEIRRREMLLRWLRCLVIPFFSVYGLFLLRPTEGHFLRYVAERRHLDTAFNAWFPPVAVGSTAQPGTKVAPDTRALTATGVPSPKGEAGARGEASLPPEAIVTVFRSERDREWAAKRFKYKKGSDDEERVARKRLLFARDRVHLPDDTVVETIRSRSERLEELRALREHPPMHLLSEQLNSIAEESHRYAAAAAAQSAHGKDAASPAPLSNGAAATPSLNRVTSLPSRGATAAASVPPKVELRFEDRFLYATAAILFRDCDDRVVRTMRFIGVCGMLWKEVA